MTLDEGLLPFQWYVVILVSLAAALIDVRTRRVPNLLTGPVWMVGLIWATWSGGLPGLAEALASSLMLAVPYVLLFAFAGGGAGDAKLMGALGAWLGFANGAIVLVAVALSGVVLAIVYALVKKRFRSVLIHLKGMVYAPLYLMQRHGKLGQVHCLMPRTDEMLAMPYGVAILAGVCIAAGAVQIWST